MAGIHMYSFVVRIRDIHVISIESVLGLIISLQIKAKGQKIGLTKVIIARGILTNKAITCIIMQYQIQHSVTIKMLLTICCLFSAARY